MDMQSIETISNSHSVTSTRASSNVKPPEQESFWGSDGFTFGDLLDVINPMQHIPVISKYYRDQTQDDACEGSRLVGGILFGGLIGGVSGVLTSIANSALRHETHRDMDEHILAMTQESLADITFSSGNELSQNNPFFAQTLDEYSNGYVYSPEFDNISTRRSRNWGKV
ncbi:MAG: hypothetical protein KAI22_04725 [Gammaproteobacteria bacterium]|nr:hypothetical protein [Gammaproteobacteria bacterium]